MCYIELTNKKGNHNEMFYRFLEETEKSVERFEEMKRQRQIVVSVRGNCVVSMCGVCGHCDVFPHQHHGYMHS